MSCKEKGLLLAIAMYVIGVVNAYVVFVPQG